LMWSREMRRFWWATHVAVRRNHCSIGPNRPLQGIEGCPTFRTCEAISRAFAKGELVFARGDPGARPYLIAIDRVRVAL
jgi:hypothetical protein